MEEDYEHQDLVRKDPRLRPVEKQRWRCLKNHMQKNLNSTNRREGVQEENLIDIFDKKGQVELFAET